MNDMPNKRNQAAFRIQKFLSGLHYPAAKPQIIQRASERGADEATLRALRTLPERDYPSPVALSCEVGRLARAP
jgi:hypothetical protein